MRGNSGRAAAGRRNDARYAYQQAIARADPSDKLTLARLHTWLGSPEVHDRRYEAAPPHFEQAKQLLGDDVGEGNQATACGPPACFFGR